MNGDRLATTRKRRGLTQVELAVAMGDRYNQQMISHVERGRSSLLVEGLIRAAQELDVSTDYLLGLTDDPAPASPHTSMDHAADYASMRLGEGGGGYSTDTVHISQVSGIPATNQGNVALSELGSLPVSQRLLEKYQIGAVHIGFIEIQGQSMNPALPAGALALVDLDRKSPEHNLIYLIVVDGRYGSASYEVRRFRREGRGDFQWHTDFYLGFQGFGSSWLTETRRQDLLNDNESTFRAMYGLIPIQHGVEVTVLGQVRGALNIFADIEGQEPAP